MGLLSRNESAAKTSLRCTVKGCTQECVNKYTLRAHLRMHTGEEPFECPEEGCNRRFRWRSSLRSHRMMHMRQMSVSGAQEDRAPVAKVSNGMTPQLPERSMSDSLSVCAMSSTPVIVNQAVRICDDDDITLPYSDFFGSQGTVSPRNLNRGDNAFMWEPKNGWENHFEIEPFDSPSPVGSLWG